MRVVGIGASAGGLEAMTSLLKYLPNNTGATFVLVQHLSPDYESIMDELLSKHTDMPVTVVREHTYLEANHIYTLANDISISFSHGMLQAHPRDHSSNLNLPIDQFFHSLGQNLKERAIGIILSGSGTDGSRGARTIKEGGGLILVQKPEEAKFNGMPSTIVRLGLADQILPIKELTETLSRIIVSNQNNPLEQAEDGLENTEDKDHFQQIVALISNQSGIDFSHYRLATLWRRTQNRMLLRQCPDLLHYFEFLQKEADEITALANDYFIGVTRFFRDEEAYEELKTQIIPKLFENKPKGELIRIWVTACSTGEEAYSIAMLVDSYINKMKLPHDFKIFASDVDQRAIRLAAKGEYPSSIVADVNAELLSTYFSQHKDHYVIKSELRDKVLFAVHNLLADPPFIRLDLVSCRNFFIYLKSATQRKILGSFHFALNPNAYLFLGPSESLGEAKHAFNRVGKKANTYCKIANGRFARPKHDFIQKEKVKQAKKPITFTDNQVMISQFDFDDNNNPFDQFLIEQFTPTCLFLNEELDILYSQGELEQILTLPRALAKMNLYKMMDHKSALLFRKGVQTALNSPQPLLYKNVTLKKKDQFIATELKFSQVQLSNVSQNVVLVEILKQEQVDTIPEEVQEIEGSNLADDQIISLEQELRSAKQKSRQLVNDLEAANEELHSSNRELMTTNEELQSTNEELQSVNEELYTVNSELQLKNDELFTANNDIRNLLRSTEIGSIFLDSDLQIRRFTPAIKHQFQLINTDIGRSITNFNSAFDDLPLEQICRQVYDTLEVFEKGIQDKQGNHYLLRILPYRTEKDIIQGLVVTFVDINDMVKAAEEVYEWAGKYQAIFKHTNDIIIELDSTGSIININKTIVGKEKEQLIGKKFTAILSKKEKERFSETLEKMYREEKSQNINTCITDPKTKRQRWYDTCFIPTQDQDSENGLLAATLIIEDVTDFREQSRKTKQALAEYEAMLDNAKHQIVLVDPDGIITHVNYTQRSGISKEEMMGSSVYNHLPPSEKKKFIIGIKNIFAGASFERIQFTYINPAGEKFETELILTPVILENKVKFVAMIGYVNGQEE